MTSDNDTRGPGDAARRSPRQAGGPDPVAVPDTAGLDEAAADAVVLDAIRKAVLKEAPVRLRRRGRRPAGVMPEPGARAAGEEAVLAPPRKSDAGSAEPASDAQSLEKSLETPITPVTPADEEPSAEQQEPDTQASDGSGPAHGPAPDDLVRIAEALLFASADPLSEQDLATRLPEGCDVEAVLADLARLYEGRGVNLVCVAGGWAFRTAADLGYLLEKERVEPKKLSRAAMETLAIIAYHQPITRAEIEELRGVSVSKGTLDVLLDLGWARMRGRKPVPGRPITYGTTDAFLDHFGLSSVMDLPGLEELKSAGLLDWRLPPDFAVPVPKGDGMGPGDGDLCEDDFEDEILDEQSFEED